MLSSKAIFFDRDGVLNVDTHYPYLPEQIHFIDGAFEAVKLANQAGYKVFVVTNQAGVARGYYSEAQVHALHRWMAEEFAKHGAYIDDFAFCPHHPAPHADRDESRVTIANVPARYHVDCNCRKPRPGMITALMEKYGINPAVSFLIGDKASDIAAATAAGIKGLLFDGKNLAFMMKALLKTG